MATNPPASSAVHSRSLDAVFSGVQDRNCWAFTPMTLTLVPPLVTLAPSSASVWLIPWIAAIRARLASLMPLPWITARSGRMIRWNAAVVWAVPAAVSPRGGPGM